jgi:hypothetical protein
MLMPRDGSGVVGDWHHETQRSFHTGCSRAQECLVMVAPNANYVATIVSRAAKPRPTGLVQYFELREAHVRRQQQQQ